jgi:hypothetical protein
MRQRLAFRHHGDKFNGRRGLSLIQTHRAVALL